MFIWITLCLEGSDPLAGAGRQLIIISKIFRIFTPPIKVLNKIAFNVFKIIHIYYNYTFALAIYNTSLML